MSNKDLFHLPAEVDAAATDSLSSSDYLPLYFLLRVPCIWPTLYWRSLVIPSHWSLCLFLLTPTTKLENNFCSL